MINGQIKSNPARFLAEVLLEFRQRVNDFSDGLCDNKGKLTRKGEKESEDLSTETERKRAKRKDLYPLSWLVFLHRGPVSSHCVPIWANMTVSGGPTSLSSPTPSSKTKGRKEMRKSGRQDNRTARTEFMQEFVSPLKGDGCGGGGGGAVSENGGEEDEDSSLSMILTFQNRF